MQWQWNKKVAWVFCRTHLIFFWGGCKKKISEFVPLNGLNFGLTTFGKYSIKIATFFGYISYFFGGFARGGKPFNSCSNQWMQKTRCFFFKKTRGFARDKMLQNSFVNLHWQSLFQGPPPVECGERWELALKGPAILGVQNWGIGPWEWNYEFDCGRYLKLSLPPPYNPTFGVLDPQGVTYGGAIWGSWELHRVPPPPPNYIKYSACHQKNPPRTIPKIMSAKIPKDILMEVSYPRSDFPIFGILAQKHMLT